MEVVLLCYNTFNTKTVWKMVKTHEAFLLFPPITVIGSYQLRCLRFFSVLFRNVYQCINTSSLFVFMPVNINEKRRLNHPTTHMHIQGVVCMQSLPTLLILHGLLEGNTVELVNQNPCQKTMEKIKLKRRKYSRAREREAQREGERENKRMERELFGPRKWLEIKITSHTTQSRSGRCFSCPRARPAQPPLRENGEAERRDWDEEVMVKDERRFGGMYEGLEWVSRGDGGGQRQKSVKLTEGGRKGENAWGLSGRWEESEKSVWGL